MFWTPFLQVFLRPEKHEKFMISYSCYPANNKMYKLCIFVNFDQNLQKRTSKIGPFFKTLFRTPKNPKNDLFFT